MPARAGSVRAASVATTSSIDAVETLLEAPHTASVNDEVKQDAVDIQYYVGWYSLDEQRASSKPNKANKPVAIVGTFCMSSRAPLDAFRTAVSKALLFRIGSATRPHYGLYYRYHRSTQPFANVLPSGDAHAYRAMLDTLRSTSPRQRHIELVVRQLPALSHRQHKHGRGADRQDTNERAHRVTRRERAEPASARARTGRQCRVLRDLASS
ncbi:hypothetical protein PsYK624_134590 [Phanerochaete sordida]|uniref:Uncharacterized protein n=1 Tax=Phanerochaete sordida TaxID=48140 RepID=A0A9P3LJE9_9APHY|nr:hypothetical protein PsYK624_134590 [Phanerochaete sordida]